MRALGVEQAIVPASFPVLTADRLRAAGVELTPDRESFDRRRRVKTGAELAGVRRAQAAAEAGMAAGRDLLRRSAANGDGALEVDGRPLTSERVKSAIAAAFLENGATGDEFVVSHGAQAAIGHHMGAGPLRAGEPIVIDLWPRDNESACSADMTRTFVVGEIPDEVAEWHRLCKRRSIARSPKPARESLPSRSTMPFATSSRPPATRPSARRRTARPSRTASSTRSATASGSRFTSSRSSASGHEQLVAGDVLAVEPGLYRPGLRRLPPRGPLLVTDAGAEKPRPSPPYESSTA